MKPFFLYMLRCRDGSFYIGHTDDLERRLEEHHAGAHDGYTCKRRPVELVWCAELPTRLEALEREMQLKGWSRAKKQALIANDWERVHALARCRSGPSTPGSLREPSAQGDRENGPGSLREPSAQGDRENGPGSLREPSARVDRSRRRLRA